jgi:hypothetical protein
MCHAQRLVPILVAVIAVVARAVWAHKTLPRASL